MLLSLVRKLVPLAVLALVATGGCASEEDPEESRQQDLIDRAAGVVDGADTPYDADCQEYGDCVYCEGRDWDRIGCTRVCYGFSCASGEEGSGCYDDCSRKAEDL